MYIYIYTHIQYIYIYIHSFMIMALVSLCHYITGSSHTTSSVLLLLA